MKKYINGKKIISWGNTAIIIISVITIFIIIILFIIILKILIKCYGDPMVVIGMIQPTGILIMIAFGLFLGGLGITIIGIIISKIQK